MLALHRGAATVVVAARLGGGVASTATATATVVVAWPVVWRGAAAVAAGGGVRRRALHATSSAWGMEEFFPVPLKEGVLPQKAGRSWTAAELRLKSFADLHALWFVCLKERNMLLSERLYYKQVGQAAPDPHRLTKVKKTMGAIKVVLGERARAQAAYEADMAAVAAGKAGGTSAGAGTDKGTPLSPAVAIQEQLKAQVKVTYKKFGRKHTVAADQAPTTPTRAERRRAVKSAIFFRNLRRRGEQVAAAEAAVRAKMGPDAVASFMAMTGSTGRAVAGAGVPGASQPGTPA